MSDGSNGRGARVEGMSVPNTSAFGIFLGDGFERLRHVELEPAEAGGLHLAAGGDQIEQHRLTGLAHAEMVDGKLRQLRQLGDVRGEGGGIDIHLRMPAGDGMHAVGQRDDVVDAVDPAAQHVEAHRTDAELAEPGDLGVGIIVGDLRDADPVRAELRQHVHQVGLVVGLERAGHDGAGDHAERLGHRQVFIERKVRRRVALVRHDRETMVDDVAMAVEQPALLRQTCCGGQCDSAGASQERTASETHQAFSSAKVSRNGCAG